MHFGEKWRKIDKLHFTWYNMRYVEIILIMMKDIQIRSENHFDNDELHTNTGGKYCYEFKPRFI